MFSSRLVHTAPYSRERSCPATTHTKDGRVENKQILSKTKVSRYDIVFFNKYWSPFVTCFIYNKLKVTFMNSFNNTGHYRKQLHYLAIKKTRLPFGPIHFLLKYIGYWSEVGFPQRKPLLRSNAELHSH
jgi:hypothetical protein